MADSNTIFLNKQEWEAKKHLYREHTQRLVDSQFHVKKNKTIMDLMKDFNELVNTPTTKLAQVWGIPQMVSTNSNEGSIVL